MNSITNKSPVQLSINGGFAHEWVESEGQIWDFNREAVFEECECGCEECGGIPLSQLNDDEILLAPGAIYRLREEQ